MRRGREVPDGMLKNVEKVRDTGDYAEAGYFWHQGFESWG